MGDMNCDGASNVVDVQMSIQVALGMPLSTALDSDGDGVVDGCTEWVSGISGDCAEGQILQWDGGLWVCADLPADSGGLVRVTLAQKVQKVQKAQKAQKAQRPRGCGRGNSVGGDRSR